MDNQSLAQNEKILSEKSSSIKAYTLSKKKKVKDVGQELVVNFKFDDYEPVSNKYQPQYKKQHGKIYYDNVDILDQSRFKYILNMPEKFEKYEKPKKSENPNKSSINYNKYSNQINSNLKWEDIGAVIYYSVDVYTCPICLEKKLVCPMITRCGHIFCWPCVVNYYDYWTNTSANKKVPKCPLCQEKINLSQIKFCEILNCVNYLSYLDSAADREKDSIEKFDKFKTKDKDKLNSDKTTLERHLSNNHNSYHTHFISFNLIMKNKNAPTLYNTFYDPDLEYYKKNLNQKDAFNFIPLENQEEFSFSKIFLTNPNLTLRKYNSLKVELEEALKDELNCYADERKVSSINTCIDSIFSKIKILKEKNNCVSDDEDWDEKQILDLKEIKEIPNTKIDNDTGQSVSSIQIDLPINSDRISNSNNQNSCNENYSTIDDDLTKNEKSDLNLTKFLYFYQEGYGDIYYLHPIDYQILLYEYRTEEHLPTELSGRILEIEMHQITPYLKNKYPFLNHLKIGSLFFFVEIDMKQIVSNHTLKNFHNILKDRAKIRHNIKREEDYYDNYVENIKFKEERQLSSELYSTPSLKFKYSEAFKDDSGNNNDEILNIESKESNNTQFSNHETGNIQNNEKKESKLKNLLENEIQVPISKVKRDFLFSNEDFPEISQDFRNNYITTNETKKMTLRKTSENYDEGVTDVIDNEIYDDYDVALVELQKPKAQSNLNNGNKGKKKKKFAEINFDLIKEIENKQLEQSNQDDPKENLKKSLTVKAPQDKQKKIIIESINGQIKKNTINSKKK